MTICHFKLGGYMRFNKKLADEYRDKWLEAKSLQEMAEIRDEYFALPFSYEKLETAWDYISLGEDFKCRGKISHEDIRQLLLEGKTRKQMAEELGCSLSKLSFEIHKFRKRGIM